MSIFVNTFIILARKAMSDYEIGSIVVASVALLTSILVPLISFIIHKKKSKKDLDELRKHNFSSYEDVIGSIADVKQANQEIMVEQKEIQKKQADAISDFSKVFIAGFPAIVQAAKEQSSKGNFLNEVVNKEATKEYKTAKQEKTSKKVQTEYNNLRKKKVDYVKIMNEVLKEQVRAKHKKARKGEK